MCYRLKNLFFLYKILIKPSKNPQISDFFKWVKPKKTQVVSKIMLILLQKLNFWINLTFCNLETLRTF